jgi:hypothetical protein
MRYILIAEEVGGYARQLVVRHEDDNCISLFI